MQHQRARDAAADSSGDIYVANYEKDDILEFSSTGTCIRSWGTHGKKDTGGVCNGNGDGTFANPYGVAVGTDPYVDRGSPGEAIYVADSNDDCIQEFTPSGTWVAQVGSPAANTVPGTFTQLRRVAVDANGNIWGADLWGNRVEEFTPARRRPATPTRRPSRTRWCRPATPAPRSTTRCGASPSTAPVTWSPWTPSTSGWW